MINCEKTNLNKISNLTIEFYNKLKNGLKPKNDEWTSLASVIEEDNENNLKLICLSTGTKVITGDKAKYENLIIDCHAESLCRRSFKVYLIEKLLEQDFQFINYKYHLFISQLPCGTYNKHKLFKDDENLQKKPGKGQINLKPTCLDKILKWQELGVQGKKLYSIFSKKVKFHSITIGNCDNEFKYDYFDRFKSKFNMVKKLNNINENNKIDQDNFVINFDKYFTDSRFIKVEGKKAMVKSICYFLHSNVYTINEIVEGRKFGSTKKCLNKTELILSPNGILKLYN